MQIFWWCHGDELQQKEKRKKNKSKMIESNMIEFF
jgi:hypothetical protein